MRSHLAVTGSRLDRAAVVVRVERIIDYLFGIICTLLLVRLALEFFNARAVGFVQFIRSVTDPLYGPFKGIFATTSVQGEHLVWPLLVCILAFMLLHAAIRGLLRLAIARD